MTTMYTAKVVNCLGDEQMIEDAREYSIYIRPTGFGEHGYPEYDIVGKFEDVCEYMIDYHSEAEMNDFIRDQITYA